MLYSLIDLFVNRILAENGETHAPLQRAIDSKYAANLNYVMTC